jgi:hypothetical protein
MLVNNQAGEMESPWVMHTVNDVGPYALASKPQSVASTGISLAFFRIQAIKATGIQLPDDLNSWSSWLPNACEQLIVSNWLIAYSPLVLARTSKIGKVPIKSVPSPQRNSGGVHPCSLWAALSA